MMFTKSRQSCIDENDWGEITLRSSFIRQMVENTTIIPALELSSSTRIKVLCVGCCPLL